MSKDIHKDLVGIDYSQLRKHKRYEVQVDCILTDLKTNVKEGALLTNISVGGVTVLHPELMNQGDMYSVEFTMPNGSPVTKYIEIRWMDSEITKVEIDGKSRDGFEHGCKFILLKKKANPVAKKKVSKVEQKEPVDVLINCYYHLEFYRELGNLMRHGYVNKVGEKNIFFSTLVELKMNEKIAVNMILNESELFNERKMSIKVLDIKRSGKQYAIKGVKV